jgi:hypothetical protein
MTDGPPLLPGYVHGPTGMDRALDQAAVPAVAKRAIPLQTTVLALAMGDDVAVAPTLCAVRYEQRLVKPAEPMFGGQAVFETHYRVAGMHRLGLAISYPAVADAVGALARRLYDRDQRGDYHLLIDAAGVGRPVVDVIRQSIIVNVHVTGVDVVPGDRGDLSLLWRNEARIGLAYLISRLRAIVAGRRIHVLRSPETAGLLDLVRDYDQRADRGPDPVRALALATSSEHLPVRYGVAFDALPSAVL